MSLPTIYTVDEVATRFGVKRQAILRRIQAKKWPHRKDGRLIYFTQADITAIDELAQQAPFQASEVTRRGVR